MTATTAATLPRARWAVTGLACRYPGIASAQALGQRLRVGAAETVMPAPDEAQRRLGAPGSTYADFGIPPIYRGSINRVQLDVLELAREALAQAGLADGEIDPERTDVIFCTAFGMNRCFENHARVLGVELAAAYAHALPAERQPGFLAAAKRRLNRAFAATSHDKVGEMASSIASRIAGCLKLRGRALALEAQDLGAVEALLAAVESLELGRARAVLVIGAQRIESPLVQRLLTQRLGAQLADALCEGACAVVLQAGEVNPTRVLAYLGDVRLAPTGAVSLAAQVRAQARGLRCYWAVGGVLDDGVLRALAADGDAVRSMRAHCGWGHAIEALTTLAHAVLVQQQLAAAGDATPVLALGQSLQGQQWALTLHRSGRAPGVFAAAQAPAAVLGVGARFGLTAGTHEYWRALCTALPQFRPLGGRRFRPELYRADSEAEPIGYYIGAASFADLPAGDAGASLAAAALADAAAQEALAQLRAPAQWIDAPVLVVTASNLTLEPERQLAAHEHVPQIERELDALAVELDIPQAQRAQGLQGLRSAACLPTRDDGTTARLLEQSAASAISRRIAARLGARAARCVAIEAACAGSLAAIELAINSLRSGRSRLAVVAGVELPVNVHDLCLCSAQRMLAPDLIATFTDRATGFTPGDGAGVLVLALDADARRLGERPLALLRAIASCTESKSVIAPNPSGQVKSMQRAFEQVEFAPADIGFIETHGTGTVIGDEVEIESLASVYGTPRAVPLRLGALKAQFGHCFSAAGIASVVKTVLALRHEHLPANHYAHPIKPELQFDARGFDPLREPVAWPRAPGGVRRAAVNAFGTGGVNVHLLLEDAPE